MNIKDLKIGDYVKIIYKSKSFKNEISDLILKYQIGFIVNIINVRNINRFVLRIGYKSDLKHREIDNSCTIVEDNIISYNKINYLKHDINKSIIVLYKKYNFENVYDNNWKPEEILNVEKMINSNDINGLIYRLGSLISASSMMAMGKILNLELETIVKFLEDKKYINLIGKGFYFKDEKYKKLYIDSVENF